MLHLKCCSSPRSASDQCFNQWKLRLRKMFSRNLCLVSKCNPTEYIWRYTSLNMNIIYNHFQCVAHLHIFNVKHTSNYIYKRLRQCSVRNCSLFLIYLLIYIYLLLFILFICSFFFNLLVFTRTSKITRKLVVCIYFLCEKLSRETNLLWRTRKGWPL